MSRIILDVGPITRIRAVERAVAQLLSSTIVGTGGVVVTGNPEDGFNVNVPFANPFEVIAYNNTKAVTAAGIKPLIDAVSQSVINTAGLATGGGQVGGGVTITVPKANNFDFVAYDDAKALTSSIVKPVIDALAAKTISVTGLGTGGGAIGSNVVINIPKANPFEIIAYDDTKPVTAFGIKPLIDAKLAIDAKATASEALAGTAGKWIDGVSLKTVINQRISEVAASDNPDLEAINELILERMQPDFSNAVFDPSGSAGAAKADLGNVVPLTGRFALNLFEVSVADIAPGIGPITGAQLQAALDFAFENGVTTVRLHPWRPHNVTEDLVIPAGVTLTGDLSVPGVPGLTNSQVGFIWTLLGSRINLAPPATIIQRGASALIKAFIIRADMEGPENDSSSFAGTAITVGGDDTRLQDCLIIGFDQIWNCNGYLRSICNNIRWDGRSGFKSINTLDIPRWRDLHGWPFGTISADDPNHSFGVDHFLFRNGVAYELEGINDWFEAFGCFSYGHVTGFDINGPLNVYLVNCNSDNISDVANAPHVVPGTRSFYIRGTTDELTLIGCFGAACETAYECAIGPGCVVDLIGSSATGVKGKGLAVSGGGMVKMTSGYLRGFNEIIPGIGGTGVSVESGVFITGPGLSVEGFANAVDANNVEGGLVGFPSIIGPGAIVNTTLFEKASADPFTPSPLHDVQRVTGSVSFGTMGATYAGHRLTLVFASTLSLYDAATIKLVGDFSAVPGATLSLVCDGAVWIETARALP